MLLLSCFPSNILIKLSKADLPSVLHVRWVTRDVKSVLIAICLAYNLFHHRICSGAVLLIYSFNNRRQNSNRPTHR